MVKCIKFFKGKTNGFEQTVMRDLNGLMNKSTEKMKEIPVPDRPYEKCRAKGASALSDTELLAVLLRSGTKGENVLKLAGRILYGPEGQGVVGLHRMSLEQLMQIRGIGEVKAIQLSCIVELSRRLSKATYEEGAQFRNPEQIARCYMEDMRHETQEMMLLVLLNSKSRLIGESVISKGTVNASLITPREIYIEALQKNAVSLVLLHNHPSGDPTPSMDDIRTTRRIWTAGRDIGIDMLDHIIIGDQRYTSFREEGMIKQWEQERTCM